MSTMTQNSNLCTIINTFTVTPERQQELVDVLIEVTDQVIRALPGFVLAHTYKSLDGVRVTNYAQWESQTALEAMRNNPEARKHFSKCREIAQNSDSHLYTVEHSVVLEN